MEQEEKKPEEKGNSIFPPMYPEPIHSVDATPDEEYVFRILEAYLQNSNCEFAEGFNEDGTGYVTNPLWDMMNKWQLERRALLQKAIGILRANW